MRGIEPVYSGMGEEPRFGSIARCSAGCVGLITSHEPKRIKYSDGKSALAWTGIHLRHGEVPGKGGVVFHVKPGDRWSSRNPHVIGHIDDCIKENIDLLYYAGPPSSDPTPSE